MVCVIQQSIVQQGSNIRSWTPNRNHRQHYY